MSELIDSVLGVYHFVFDRTPGNLPLVEPRPRTVNQWRRDGKALISKVEASGDVKASVQKAISLLGDLDQVIRSGDRVLVKPNFNSPDAFPGSTDLTFLRAVLELLLETGASVTIGESSGGMWRPTRTVFRKLGVFELGRQLGVQVVAFEDSRQDWVKIRVGGDYLRHVTMPRPAYEADKLVYLPCMKTHRQARFTGALKLSVGFMHPGERRSLHVRHLEEKVAEINLCWQPDLIIMDGRKAFVAGGPDTGQVVEPGVLLASGDLVATDVEAMGILLAHKADNRLPVDPWQSRQVTAALRHGLGSAKGEYRLVE